MGRSVSYPNDCAAVCFIDVSDYHEMEEWHFFIEWLQERCQEAWKSLDTADEWLGREDHAVLENQHCYIGVSEYCRLAAVWLKPKEDNDYPEHDSLHAHWCNQISKRFEKMFGEYRLIGRASNGEAFFEKIEEAA